MQTQGVPNSPFQGLSKYNPHTPPLGHSVGTNEATITAIPENAPCWHIPLRPREICRVDYWSGVRVTMDSSESSRGDSSPRELILNRPPVAYDLRGLWRSGLPSTINHPLAESIAVLHKTKHGPAANGRGADGSAVELELWAFLSSI